MSNISGRGLLAGLLFVTIAFNAPARAESPFCSDPGCKATRQLFKQLCDFISENKADEHTIYTGGYYMRTLVAGYEILGEQRYLDVATAYADHLVKIQMARGYWGTGYGGIEIADTGSALGLFCVLYKHVDKDRQEKYVAAVRRFVTAVEKDGFIYPSGALGYGWETKRVVATSGSAHGGTSKEEITTKRGDSYTIATGLTGGEVFTWVYYLTKDDRYRQMAFNALRWILSTMRKDGVIPNVDGTNGAFWEKQGDPANDFLLWDVNTYQACTYAGEGFVAFDLYSDQPEWKAELRWRIKPHIEFLLRTQNSDGTWGVRRSADSTYCLGTGDPARSPGVANVLIWYYEQVDKDPRIITAVQKFDRFLLNPEQAKRFGLLNFGAQFVRKCENTNTVTSLTGRALSDILVPGITARW